MLTIKNRRMEKGGVSDKRVFGARKDSGQERISVKKGLQSRKMEGKVVLPETAGNITEIKKNEDCLMFSRGLLRQHNVNFSVAE